MNNLSEIIKVLSEAKIDFVIIGGFAAILYGSSQVTKDVDICALMTTEHIEKIRSCLALYHPKHRMTPQKLSFLEVPEDLRGLKNIYLQTDIGIIDILGEVPGVGSFAEIKQRADEVEVEGQKVKVISIDDLIKSKKIVGRPKDHATVLELNIIREKIR